MIKTKVAFLEGQLFFSQSGFFENFSDCFDWMDKSRPSEKATFVLIMLTGYISLFWGGTKKDRNIAKKTKK